MVSNRQMCVRVARTWGSGHGHTRAMGAHGMCSLINCISPPAAIMPHNATNAKVMIRASALNVRACLRLPRRPACAALLQGCCRAAGRCFAHQPTLPDWHRMAACPVGCRRRLVRRGRDRFLCHQVWQVQSLVSQPRCCLPLHPCTCTRCTAACRCTAAAAVHLQGVGAAVLPCTHCPATRAPCCPGPCVCLPCSPQENCMQCESLTGACTLCTTGMVRMPGHCHAAVQPAVAAGCLPLLPLCCFPTLLPLLLPCAGRDARRVLPALQGR